MFFRSQRPRDVRAAAWVAMAARLGLSRVDGGEELLERLVGPDPEPLTAGVFRLPGDDLPDVLVFERRAQQSAPVASCLLTVPAELATAPLRVTRRLRAQLSSFQASATQASLVVTGDADFDEAVTVMARDADRAGLMLTPAARQALARLVHRGVKAPVLVVSEAALLASAELEDPAGVELLITDVLAVYAALAASPSA